jgi:predicted Zn-dependent peptidase
LQQLREKVVTLTKEDVLAAAKKHLHPEYLKIIAVGSGKTLPAALATFGEVKEIKSLPE